MFNFFTAVISQDVVDKHGRWIGRPYDFGANLDEVYPRLTSLIVSQGLFKKQYYVIPWNNLHHAGDQFQLKVPIEALIPVSSYRDETEITLRKNILDQQVVDTYNRKVVRVNDIHFLEIDNELRIAHVDVGIRGLIRRLGWEGLIDRLIKGFSKHSKYLISDKFIPWKFIQPLSIQPTTGKIQLNVDYKQLLSIPPADLSDMLMELDTYQRAALFKTLDSQRQIDILTELELKWQVDLFEELSPQIAADLLERMPADEATDLLGAFPRREAERFIRMLSPKKSREVIDLLRYEAQSAGGLMTKEFIDLTSDLTVKQALDHICHVELKKAETIQYSYIVDKNFKLIGSVLLRELLIADPSTKISSIMLKNPPSLHIENNLEETASMLSKYNLFAAPVINDSDILEGIVTVDDVLAVVIEEEWGKRP